MKDRIFELQKRCEDMIIKVADFQGENLHQRFQQVEIPPLILRYKLYISFRFVCELLVSSKSSVKSIFM